MKNKPWIIGGVAVLAIGGWFGYKSFNKPKSLVEYRYQPVSEGELILSTSATGVLVPLTTVDIKSKAGGTVETLLVEEGTEVKAGQVIALIDPRDTQSTYEQAQAEATIAQSNVDQAEMSLNLTRQEAETNVKNAENALRVAEISLAKAREINTSQPRLTQSAIANAEAALRAERENLTQLQNVDIPQRRSEAQAAVRTAEADLKVAQADFDRQTALYDRGYVAKSVVDRASASLEAAKSTEATARQRLSTIERSFESELTAQRARLTQAEASLQQARSNGNQITLAEQDVRQAERAVEQARTNLTQARADRIQVQLGQKEVESARASRIRSDVQVDNAKVQLDSTQVVAPRNGVVTMKYLEEGTIIPPGTSVFSEGTSIVQLADVTQMFVECDVDETDVSNIKIDQPVRIIVESYPGQKFRGVVRKVFPAALNEESITSIKVRVEILDIDAINRAETPLRPGITATCEFIEFQQEDALILPQQALETEGDEHFVLVKSADATLPTRRKITIGQFGNDGIEVLEGLEPGEEVVVAKIDLADMEERLERIQQAEQGGGFTGGGR